jgi:hypothetical protein
LSKYTKLCDVNDKLRSFDLGNNHEHLDEDNPSDYKLESIA